MIYNKTIINITTDGFLGSDVQLDLNYNNDNSAKFQVVITGMSNQILFQSNSYISGTRIKIDPMDALYEYKVKVELKAVDLNGVIHEDKQIKEFFLRFREPEAFIGGNQYANGIRESWVSTDARNKIFPKYQKGIISKPYSYVKTVTVTYSYGFADSVKRNLEAAKSLDTFYSKIDENYNELISNKLTNSILNVELTYYNTKDEVIFKKNHSMGSLLNLESFKIGTTDAENKYYAVGVRNNGERLVKTKFFNNPKIRKMIYDGQTLDIETYAAGPGEPNLDDAPYDYQNVEYFSRYENNINPLNKKSLAIKELSYLQINNMFKGQSFKEMILEINGTRVPIKSADTYLSLYDIKREPQTVVTLLVTAANGFVTKVETMIEPIDYSYPKLLDVKSTNVDSWGNETLNGDYQRLVGKLEVSTLSSITGSSINDVGIVSISEYYSINTGKHNGTLVEIVESGKATSSIYSFDITIKIERGEEGYSNSSQNVYIRDLFNSSTFPEGIVWDRPAMEIKIAGIDTDIAIPILDIQPFGVGVNKFHENGSLDVYDQIYQYSGDRVLSETTPYLTGPPNPDFNDYWKKGVTAWTSNSNLTGALNAPSKSAGVLFSETNGDFRNVDNSLKNWMYGWQIYVTIFGQAYRRNWSTGENYRITYSDWSQLYATGGDIVVEEGNNSRGSWKKWASGRLTQKGIYDYTHTAGYSEAWGVVYTTNGVRVTYPIPFVGAYPAFTTYSDPVTGGASWSSNYSAGTGSLTQSMIFSSLRPSKTTSSARVKYNWTAEGYWK